MVVIIDIIVTIVLLIFSTLAEGKPDTDWDEPQWRL